MAFTYSFLHIFILFITVKKMDPKRGPIIKPIPKNVSSEAYFNFTTFQTLIYLSLLWFSYEITSG